MFGYVVLGVFAVICVVMYYALINNPLKIISRMQRWPMTRGKITAIRTDVPGLYDIYEYEYSVGGKQYKGTRTSCLNPGFKSNSQNQSVSNVPSEIAEFQNNHTQVGEEVDVYYNQSNPEEAYLIKLKNLPKQAWVTYYKFVIIGGIAVFALVPTTIFEIFLIVQQHLLA